MTTAPLVFPVLCFGPDVGRYAVAGREVLDWLINEEDFSTCMVEDATIGLSASRTPVKPGSRRCRA